MGVVKIFRRDCRRFVNGIYAGIIVYMKVKQMAYIGYLYWCNDRYEHSPNKYLCTHINYCGNTQDVFGRTMMEKMVRMMINTYKWLCKWYKYQVQRKYAVCDVLKIVMVIFVLKCSGSPNINIGNGNPFSSKVGMI